MAYQPRIVSLNGNTTYHDEIRARLGTDSGTVPDIDIDAPSVLPVAEAKVVARVPDYASLTADNQVYVYAAAILMTAALIAPSMRNRLKLQEGDSDYKYAKADIDWVKRGQELEDEAYGMIDLIGTQTVVNLSQIGVSGPTTYKQQQLVAQGESGQIYPNSGDISLYPTNVE